MRRLGKLRLAILVISAVLLLLYITRPHLNYWYLHLKGEKTVGDVIRKSTEPVKTRLEPYFKKAGLEFPLKKLSLLAFKCEKRMELWGAQDGTWRFIRSYPILAASGHSGPKLREGDRQVPEGIYRIIALNPNGLFYLTMLIDYPNEFDLKNAAHDHRTNLGGDICIHGKAASIGCLAMGDTVAEELFVLVALAGMENATVIIAPNDLRVEEPQKAYQMSIDWVPGLYRMLKEELKKYPVPKEPRRKDSGEQQRNCIKS